MDITRTHKLNRMTAVWHDQIIKYATETAYFNQLGLDYKVLGNVVTVAENRYRI